jgi:broad specificity phosphatase PhoE
MRELGGRGMLLRVEGHFVTHPEVGVDPSVPVPEWGLSDSGRSRLDRLLELPWARTATCVASSAERKARETADALARVAGVEVLVDADLGENDRSATGFLPPDEFEAVADEFFAHPSRSARGWETAHAAQRRVVRAVERLLRDHPDQRLVIVSHGGVGTLLQCSLAGVDIDRRHDQPGQGSWYRFDGASWQLLHGWRRI